MRKAARIVAASNVIPFPGRTAATSSKAANGRARKRSNVLQFTGKKIKNIDGAARAELWKSWMLESLTKTALEIDTGEVKGIVLIKLQGIPVESEDTYPPGRFVASGAYNDDLELLASHMQTAWTLVEELEKDSPTRWV